jgi:hypothetical protein
VKKFNTKREIISDILLFSPPLGCSNAWHTLLPMWKFNIFRSSIHSIQSLHIRILKRIFADISSPFYGKNALTKAAEYILNDGCIEIDNNPAESAIRPNVVFDNLVLSHFYKI